MGSESSEMISARASTRRFSMCVSGRWSGWITSARDYRLHPYQGRMSSMSAGIKITETDTSNSPSLPNSRRVYLDGKLPGVRVPFREIAQSETRNFDGTMVPNPPVCVYDTSGPWGDPALNCDVREGLPQLRREWIASRGDVEEYTGRESQPIDDG